MMRDIIDILLCRPTHKERQFVQEIREKSSSILSICRKTLVDGEGKEILFEIAISTAQGLGRLEGIYGMEEK